MRPTRRQVLLSVVSILMFSFLVPSILRIPMEVRGTASAPCPPPNQNAPIGGTRYLVKAKLPTTAPGNADYLCISNISNAYARAGPGSGGGLNLVQLISRAGDGVNGTEVPPKQNCPNPRGNFGLTAAGYVAGGNSIIGLDWTGIQGADGSHDCIRPGDTAIFHVWCALVCGDLSQGQTAIATWHISGVDGSLNQNFTGPAPTFTPDCGSTPLRGTPPGRCEPPPLVTDPASIPGGVTTLQYCILVDKTLDFAAERVGHAWTELIAFDVNGNRIYDQGYGFWPASGISDIELFAANNRPRTLLGQLNDDSSYGGSAHLWDYGVCWDSNSGTFGSGQWQSVAGWINSLAPNLLTGKANTTLTFALLSPNVVFTVSLGLPRTFNCIEFAVISADIAPVTNLIRPGDYGNKYLPKVADPAAFGLTLADAFVNNDKKYAAGTVQKSAGATDPVFELDSTTIDASLDLVGDEGFANPFGLASALGLNFYTGTLPSSMAMFGQQVSFSSPFAFDLSQSVVGWDFGDGPATTNNRSPRVFNVTTTNHAYLSDGTFTVSFFAINDTGVWSYTGTVTVSGGTVGGTTVPRHEPSLSVPYIGITSLVATLIVVAAVYQKLVRRANPKVADSLQQEEEP